MVDYVRTTVQRRPELGRYSEVEMEEWKDEIGGVDDLEQDLGIKLPVDESNFAIGEVDPEDVGIHRPVDPFNYGDEEA